MSLAIDGVWKKGVWAETVWAYKVWRIGGYAFKQIEFTLAINRLNNYSLAMGRNILHTLSIAREKEL